MAGQPPQGPWVLCDRWSRTLAPPPAWEQGGQTLDMQLFLLALAGGCTLPSTCLVSRFEWAPGGSQAGPRVPVQGEQLQEGRRREI